MKSPPTRLVLLGAPGSGKGTQGVRLAGHFGVPYLSSGELLRHQVATGTPLGRQVAGSLDRGDLVPDDLATAVVSEALRRAVPAGGYVLDGFPRTLAQARLLEALAPPDAVVHLSLPDEVARRRLARRAGTGRTDDADRAVVERRLAQFHDETEPLLDFYANRGILTTVDAAQSPEAVTTSILRALTGVSRRHVEPTGRRLRR